MVVSRVRALIVATMTVLLAVATRGIFDETSWTLVGVTAAMSAAAVFVARLATAVRAVLSSLIVVVGVVAATVAVGGDVTDVVPGLVDGPQRLLTTEWPSPVDPRVVACLALLLGLTAVIGVWLATEAKAHLLPLVPVVLAFAAIVALGAPIRTPWWLVVALGVLALALALIRPDRPGPASSSPLGSVPDRSVIVSTAAVVAATLATSGAVAWADRADPRRTEDADVSSLILDPIEATVALRAADPTVDLFEVDDRSTLIGRSLPPRWRVAALADYDGQRWLPELVVRPIGGRLGLPSPPAPTRAPAVRYDLELLTDDFAVIPFPGRPLEVDRDVETDVDRVVVKLMEEPEAGLVVEAVSEIAPGLVEARASSFATRQVDEIADDFTERARSIAGADQLTQLEQLQELATTMREEWQRDPNAPGGGQQIRLIERFILETQRGTREQFVTAFVLLARSLGFDARVATGFVVPPDEFGNPLLIRSDHAQAWPEVRLETGGWVAFDPVPAAQTDEEEEPPPQPEAQSPAAAQPPIPPPSEEADEDDDDPVVVDEGEGQWRVIARWAVRVVAVGGLTVLPFAIAIGTILLLKWRRRRRRLRHAEPARRIRGVWANTTDDLIDAGLDIAPSWTDERIAEAAAPLARRAPFELRRLAAMSTEVTFGPLRDSSGLVPDAVQSSRMIDVAMRIDQTRLERIRCRLSLRSLRAGSRSPVVV